MTIAFVAGSLLVATSMMVNKQRALAPTSQQVNQNSTIPISTTSSSRSVRYETIEQPEGNVTVIVTPLTLETGKPPVFQIVFETHSVDLSFDVSTITTLTDDTGILYGVPVWNGTPPGGHHRKGTLSFSQPLTPSIQQVTITFLNIADVPKRTFAWQMKPS